MAAPCVVEVPRTMEELLAENAMLRKEVKSMRRRFSELYEKFSSMLDALIEATTSHFSVEYGWYCEDHYYSGGKKYSPDHLELELSSIRTEYDVSDLCEGIDLYSHYLDDSDDAV